MSKDSNKEKNWDNDARNYDKRYETFEGAVEHYIDTELLKKYLPRNRTAKILDAAGGTGRITLPLAKRGYSVTLCDISPAMLEVAREKLSKENMLDKVEIIECDVCKLNFSDETFDFVICWDGMIKAITELIRVTKRGGKFSIFLVNKCGVAISDFRKSPKSALALLESDLGYIYHNKESNLSISVEEVREIFKTKNVRILGIYAVYGMLELLAVSEDIRKSREWDDDYFSVVTEMLLRMSMEPSVKGLSRRLVIYGERI